MYFVGNPMQSQQTLITSESLELGAELGQGEFGSVLKGVWTDPKGGKVTRAASLLNGFKNIPGKACVNGVHNNYASVSVGN